MHKKVICHGSLQGLGLLLLKNSPLLPLPTAWVQSCQPEILGTSTNFKQISWHLLRLGGDFWSTRAHQAADINKLVMEVMRFGYSEDGRWSDERSCPAGS